MLFAITVQATIEVEANSEAEALRRFDLGDGDVERILCVECFEEDD